MHFYNNQNSNNLIQMIQSGKIKNIYPKRDQVGRIDKTFVSENKPGKRVAKIRICTERIPEIGDKFASRAGQKGTCGLIINEVDMPFTSEGLRPDLIINPHALPSRMTIGQIVESLFGKVCTSYGAFGDCTAFLNVGPKEKQYGKLLVNEGFHASGTQILYNGMTGEQIQSDIYIGPTYYMRLKHMVKDKINYRARGPRTLLTRQTVQGRANDGGLRIGEMERDGIIAHGVSHFLQESMMIRGDEYFMAICNKTGTIAVYNAVKNVFLSPAADGPLLFNKTLDGNQVLNVYSKYGRSFSLLRIPYALKLLIQELQVMGIQMRMITEDNIDQLLNLSYQSQNINKLLHIDELSNTDIKTIIDNYKKDMDAKIKQTEGEVYNEKNANIMFNNELIKPEPQSLEKDNIESLEEASLVPGVELPEFIMLQKFMIEGTNTETLDLVTEKNSPRPGRSGGGLMNDEGFYIGTCWGTQYRDGTGKGYFTPLSVIHRFWSKQNGYAFLLEQKSSSGAAQLLKIIDHSNSGLKFAAEYIILPVK
jgi:DNA-directed RNA polymerase II subunit RPB2